MEIRRLLDDNKSATLYTFPCKRWLAKGEDDGAIVRELVPRDVTEEIVDKNGEVVTNKVEHESLDGKKQFVPNFFQQLETNTANTTCQQLMNRLVTSCLPVCYNLCVPMRVRNIAQSTAPLILNTTYLLQFTNIVFT